MYSLIWGKNVATALHACTHTDTMHCRDYIHCLYAGAFLDILPIHLTEAWEWNWRSWAERWHSRHKQLLPASMASLSGQWFGAAKWHSCNVLLEQFPHKYFHSPCCASVFACVGVWAPTISGMSVILKKGTCLRDKLLHLLKNKIPVNSRELSWLLVQTNKIDLNWTEIRWSYLSDSKQTRHLSLQHTKQNNKNKNKKKN